MKDLFPKSFYDVATSWQVMLFVVPGFAIIGLCVLYETIVVHRNEAIHNAVWAGDVAGVREILDTDASALERRSRSDMTPLNQAVRSNRAGVLALLIERGASVNAKWNLVATGDGAWNPLHIAANFGCLETMKLLIPAGTEINARTLKGETPLDCAVRNGNEECAALLRKHGAVRGLPRKR